MMQILIVNLSVEVWNYYPVSFKEITSAVSAFKKEEKKAIVQGDTKGDKWDMNIGQMLQRDAKGVLTGYD